jgi:5'-3' exonuclease|tara:strand:+ start:1481 stop:2305 length:825 start_codon:yes stop_codon:yes gene_type:complete
MNQISVASLMMHLHMNKGELEEDMVRHMILNSVRMYRTMFNEDYGEIVLAYDSRAYWRKEIFPQYKSNRRKNREEDNKDWDSIFGVLNNIKEEIKEFLPYKVVEVYGAEADDVIATLCKHYQNEKVMIVSGDKDFIQLQKYDNVKQYSPITKKLVDGVDPKVYIKEHVLKGDKSDGVPNVLSPDHTFTDELRQRPLTSKKLESILAQDIDELDDEIKRNYQRNDKLINLDNIPKTLESEILNSFNEASYGDRSGLLNYFIEKRLTSLTENIGEF